MMFDSESEIDIVLFGGRFVPGDGVLEEYASRGDIWLPDGEFGYVSEGWEAPNRAGCVLWINKAWLVALGKPIPTTCDELEEVLEAFKNDDPNGNGIRDEIPLAGSLSSYDLNPVEFILGSYVENDPYHSRMTADGRCYATEERYREGLEFCNELYEKGLMDNRLITCSAPGCYFLGGFARLYSGNPEIMAKYVHVPPLKGSYKTATAMLSENRTKVGAIILSRSKKKEEAKLLLDTMMTEEASLIARFGEPGVDWEYSDGKDISIYMTPSTIITRNYIVDVVQNKNLNGIGPMRVPEKYIYGVTWNGLNSDYEYVDARAQMAYMEYLVQPGDAPRERNENLSAYLDGYMTDFVSGKKDITNDRIWDEYVAGAEEIMH